MNYPELWQAPFNEASACGYRVAVCDSGGHMLACSNLEGHVVAGGPRLLGSGWHEFVHEADLPAVLDYFRNGQSGDTVSYRQLCQIDGRPVMADITILKVWAGSAWLVYGAVRSRRPHAQRQRHEHGG